MNVKNNTENQICCLICKYYEIRSQFCRKNPPIPTIVPDKYGAHMMSAFPKISCPNFDFCSYFEHANNLKKING